MDSTVNKAILFNNIDACDVRNNIRQGEMMYKILDKEFDTLAQAMVFAKEYGKFVVITDGELEIVGNFGVDSIVKGICPNGTAYTWKKRRI